ncbi:MAG: helix-turn-helix domain-containing protein [Flavobacteriales bacterium]|nr:helix-turn-helix domain-containing protein [Flavobacteriales bacterium]
MSPKHVSLHLARQTIYGLTSKKRIPFLKSRGKLVFWKADLLEWVENGNHEPLYFN